MGFTTFYISGKTSAFIEYFQQASISFEASLNQMFELLVKSALYDLYITEFKEEIDASEGDCVYQFTILNELLDNMPSISNEHTKLLLERIEG